jgi:hypothetical protein
MPYTQAEAQQQLLDALARAVTEIGVALAALGEAYEQLDDSSAGRLERELFRPAQVAYGRSQRAHSEFAARHHLPGRVFAPASQGAPSRGVKSFLEDAAGAIANADATLAALQDSMLPVEVGDPELRAGLEDVRRLIGDFGARVRAFMRTLGR